MMDRDFKKALEEPAKDGAPDGHTWVNPPALNLVGMTAHRDYWKKRCEAAERFIEVLPAPEEINILQIADYENWQKSK